MFGGIDDHAVDAHRLDDLNADGTHARVDAVGLDPAAGEDRVLSPVVHDGEGSVHQLAVRV